MTEIMLYLLLSSGLVLIAGSLYQYWKYRRQIDWPVTSIDIISSDILYKRVVSGNVVWDCYYPQVRYAYYFGGEKYESSVITKDSMSITFLDRSKAEEKLRELITQGQGYINPKDNADAVLIAKLSRKRQSHICAIAISGLLLTIISSLFFFFLPNYT
jgi:hypothetical protein